MIGFSEREMNIDSEEGNELWQQMLRTVFEPVRIIPTIATNSNMGNYFLLAFGLGDNPDHTEEFATMAIPIDVMEAMAIRSLAEIAEFRKEKIN